MKKLFLFLSLLITTSSAFAQITGAMHICVGDVTAWSDATSGGTWTSSNTTIASVGLSSGLVTGMAAGMCHITYTMSGGGTTVAGITVNPLPPAITGIMTVCQGTTTTLGDAAAGGTWSSSSPPCGTINPSGVVTGISGPCTTTITYTLPTGCYVSALVRVLAGPAVRHIYGGGVYCPGSPCPHIYMDSSEVGVNYQVYCGVTPIGSPIAGTGSTIDIGSFCTACVYTVVATNVTTGCSTTMSGTVTVSVGVLPTVFIVGGGGTHCDSTTCPHVTLNNSQIGVTYKVMCGSTVVTSRGGTGAPIDFGPECTNCTYSVVATNDATGCSSTMSGTAVVSSSVPCIILGPTSVCVGSSISLSGCSGCTWSSSDVSIATVGACTGVVTGINAGVTHITYTSAGGCISVLTITVNPLPAIFVVGGGGGHCDSSSCPHITLSGSQLVVTYHLYCGTTAITARGGTGGVLDFGPICGTCVYSVTAINDITSCASNMSGTATVSSSTPCVITGGHSICVGQSETLSGCTGCGWSSSNPAVATIGSCDHVVTGMSAGVVNITYTNGTCFSVFTITVNPLPVITGSVPFCTGFGLGTGITLTTTDAPGTWGISPGTYAVLYPFFTTAVLHGVLGGVETVTFTSSVTGCSASITATVEPAPAIFTVTGGGVYCTGPCPSCPHVYLSGSEVGVNYQIFCGSTPLFPILAGTGAALDFGTQCGPCTYTIKATNTISGCTSTMSGSVSSTPIVPCVITGPTTVCVGSDITLSGCSGTCGWSSSSPGTATVGSCSGDVHGVTAGVVTITFTSLEGCISTYTVTVNPVCPIIGPLTVCLGQTITLTSPCTGGVWTSSRTSVATIAGTGVLTPVTTGTTTVTFSSLTGCSNSVVVTVNTVPAAPVISGGPLSMCVGGTVALTGTATGGTWMLFNLGTPVCGTLSSTSTDPTTFTGTASGVQEVLYIVSNACGSNVAWVFVSVNVLPPISGPTSVCTGYNITLSEGTTGTWTSSMPLTGSISPATGLSTSLHGIMSGTTTVTFTTSAGCSTSVVVTVNQTPVISGILAYCAYASYIPGLTGSPSGGSWTETTTGHASLVSLSASTSPINAFGPGTETFTYTTTAGCHSSAVVTINPIPHLTGSTSMCMGSSMTLTPSVTGPGTPTWTIYPGTHATISGGVVTAPVTSGGPYVENISYSINGCVTYYTITINPTPVIGGPSDVCIGASITEPISYGTGSWNLVPVSPYATNAPTGGTYTVVTGHAVGTVVLHFTGTTGCPAAPKTIHVWGLPNPGTITVVPGEFCWGSPGATITMGGADPGGTWFSSCTGVTVSGTHIIVAPWGSGLPTIGCGLIYTVTSTHGCGSRASATAFSVDACIPRTDRHTEGDEMSIITSPELKVFPNPNQGTFTVNLLSDKNESAEVKITNMVGETVKKFTTATNIVNEVKINNAPGIYLVMVTTAHGSYVAKIVAE